MVAEVVPNPAASSASGDPFGGGAKISFASCPPNPVTLYTATVFAIVFDASVEWQVQAHSSPTEPGTTCATAVPCAGGGGSCVFPGYPHQLPRLPSAPSPPNGATNVELHPSLASSWSSGACVCGSDENAYIRWYFGTDPNPPLFFEEFYESLPQLDLEPSTTYYWRIEASYCGDPFVEGPVWSFTTGPPVGVEPATWSNVKQIYR